jgi:hypothetical protein
MQNITEFFKRLHDIDFPYVVLRNFEGLPESITIGGHGDLDLLVYDLDHWMELFPQAVRVYPHPRVQFKMPLGETNVYMDIRYVGDDYYPEELEQAILDSREYNEKGFFTPNPIHFRIALAYHVVHHKGENTYPRFLGSVSVEDLLDSLKKSNIGWVKPADTSVGRFNPYWKGATSVVEKTEDGIKKTQVSYGKYNLTDNEYRILSAVSSIHFPKVLSHEKDSIGMEDCGVPLTVDNLPVDWKAQLVQILLALKAEGIEHRDIRPDNLMVKDGIIKLIDFGWARLKTDPEDRPPTCLGYPYKPTYGFDDNYSMKMIIKQLEYQLEEKIACVC